MPNNFKSFSHIKHEIKFSLFLVLKVFSKRVLRSLRREASIFILFAIYNLNIWVFHFTYLNLMQQRMSIKRVLYCAPNESRCYFLGGVHDNK